MIPARFFLKLRFPKRSFDYSPTSIFEKKGDGKLQHFFCCNILKNHENLFKYVQEVFIIVLRIYEIKESALHPFCFLLFSKTDAAGSE